MERPIKDSICYRNTSLKRGMKRTAKSSTCNNTVNLKYIDICIKTAHILSI